MPTGAEILHVGVQGHIAYIWALVDPDERIEARSFRVYETGHPIDGDLGRHIGSFTMLGGALVWHVFEPSAA